MSSDTEEREWVAFIKHELEDSKLRVSVPSPSIFMASSPLRGLKLEAFIPQVVAIGPYHSDLGPHHSAFPETAETQRYKSIAAKEMEMHKVMAARKTATKFRSKDFCALADEILQAIDQVRDEYDSCLDCKLDEKLAYMLALDASFVVDVLRSSAVPGYSRFPRPLRKSILQDFVLLENQIPLFLLEKVIKMDEECPSDEQAKKTLGALVTTVACEVLPFSFMSEDSYSSVVQHVETRKHLLDCLYGMVTYQGSSTSKGRGVVERPTHFPRAVDLYNSGVTFRSKPGNMMDVRYNSKRAILYVPKIRVGDDTERLFRNLIAYESHLVSNVEVLSYLRFMNSLVDTPEDVALLVEQGIIAQDIGSNEEVANMWNNLCVNTMRVCSEQYEEVATALVKHSNVQLNALKAEFKRTYLSRPWLVVSLLSGAALLVMTFIITYYTIELYLKDG